MEIFSSLTITNIVLAFLGGVFPAMIWLYYWLKEDTHPEPRKLIILTFIYGMLTVPFVLLIQFAINNIFLKDTSIEILFRSHYPIALIALILWATTEELFKYLAAYFGGLSKKANDEPVDVMVYLITAALGFSALENALFLLTPLSMGDAGSAIITGNLRFIGATLLHVASSAIIGLFVAFAYYKSQKIKIRHWVFGFITAISLHTIFNSFIIRAEEFTLIGFAAVWITIIVVIMLFEKIKKLYKPN